MTTRKQAPRCVVCKRRPQAKGRLEKCMGCYLQDWRAGHVSRKTDDLGPDPKRVEFEAPSDLVRRFHEAVSAGGRPRVLRRALEAELRRMAEAFPEAPLGAVP
jgi:hypothetical protein